MSGETRKEGFSEDGVIKEPVTLEDIDRVIKNALAREDDGRFELTPGQEATIRMAAEREEQAIKREEGRI